MAKILPILLFLAFVAYGQSTDAFRKFGNSYVKCCCSEEAVGDKDCENILRNVIEPGSGQYKMELERFQKEVKSVEGIELLCAVIKSKFACGNSCDFLACPGRERNCSVNARYDDLLEDD
ncbi:MAG: hypothetical protein FWB90_08690 [Fibromonadales bacterium]|nr:hypothetical protein [Fibromonadales bacterium]